MSDFMVWVVSVFGAVLLASVLGFWGWVATRIIDLYRKIADLEARMTSNEALHADLLSWLRAMDAKLGVAAENIAGLREAVLSSDRHSVDENKIVARLQQAMASAGIIAVEGRKGG